MATRKPKQPIIIDWEIVGTQENFTVLGKSDDDKVYYWKDQQWNLL